MPFIRTLIEPFSVVSLLLVVWIAVMIMVPIVRWTFGKGAERIGIAAGVFAQVAAVAAALGVGNGLWAIAALVLVPGLGWLSEVIGSRTGYPFGPYHYTDVLQPQVARVPILIPLAWLMMMPPSWAVGSLLFPHSLLLRWIVAAAAFTAWDVYLDPMMVSWRFWEWKRKGAYVGIPLVNFAGWFGVALLITALVGSLSWFGAPDLTNPTNSEPLIAIYLVTWPLMLIGQFFFWNLRVSAVTGFLVMGAVAVPVLTRIL